MQASKWLKSQILIDVEEMQQLLTALDPFFIYNTSSIVNKGSGLIPKQEFLNCYKEYIVSLQNGKIPDEQFYRAFFSSIFTVSPDLVFSMPINETQELIRVERPVVQLQSHRISYSTADGEFRSMTFGGETILWGIQFSYPQLFQDPITTEIVPVGVQTEFPNTSLFQKIQKWVRNHTVPTPFLVGSKQVNVPMRLGNNCFAWINQHPQLTEIKVKV